MRRALTISAIGLTAVMSYGLYNMKYEVRRLENRVSELHQKLGADREALQVLRAEWAYLNRPDRLQGLAVRHLDLSRVVVSQIGTLEDLPVRPAAVVEKTKYTSADDGGAQ